MENKIRVAIILSQIDKSRGHEWFIEGIDTQRFRIFFILMNSEGSEMEEYLKRGNTKYLRIHYQDKNDIPKSIIQTVSFLIRNKIQVVHAHLLHASLVGLFASKIAGIRKRIYTRHHSSFHQEYFPNMVKYDRLINWLATDIIAPSAVVKNILIQQEKVAEEKVHLIHHGFRFNEFHSVNNQRIEKLRRKYKVNGSPVIGVISRWTKWKGVQFIVSAFHQLLKDFPDAQLVLANAKGEYMGEIEQLLHQQPENSFRTILFEEDFIALYRLFDVFVHVPVNDHCEAFGQVYVEALASGIPSVFTLSGIASEFIRNEEHALLVPYESSDAIYFAIRRLLNDKNLTAYLVSRGKAAVESRFTFDFMMDSVEKLYLQE